MVTSLPSSNSNKRYAYARAEYRDVRGRRRVLVFQADMASDGRRGAVSLREDLGANDLPGTRTGMNRTGLQDFLVRLEASGRITVAGDEIVFPPHLLREFLARCRARLDDAAAGRLGTTGPYPAT